MAVRIRKLARELGRTPAEVLGILHALGFARYRSSEDMLSGSVEARVRRGVARGVQPVPLDVEPVPRRAASGDRTLEELASQDDLMARLVPGVKPTRSGGRPPGPPSGAGRVRRRGDRPVEPKASPVPPPASAAPEVSPAPPPSATPAEPADAAAHGAALRALETERSALESLRSSIQAEETLLAARRAELEEDTRRLQARERSVEAERAALDQLRHALERERAALAATREALSDSAARARRHGERTLQELLEERGLRGADEFERVLAGLAVGRHLRELVWALRVDPAEPVRRLLANRVVLAEGAPPEAGDPWAQGLVRVEVGSDRAELAPPARVDALVERVGEALLLNGFRRWLVVGGRTSWQRAIREHVDPRIEVRCAPRGERSARQAQDDLQWADVVALWDVPLEAGVSDLYANGRARVVTVGASGPADFLQATLDALG